MASKEVNLTYTFVNPNSPKEFETMLKKILIDRILSSHAGIFQSVISSVDIQKGNLAISVANCRQSHTRAKGAVSG